MPDTRPSIKIDFTGGLEQVPPRPKMDAATTHASVVAGRQLGFASRGEGIRLDGRRLRSRGATTQLNIKVTADEKEAILEAASEMIRDSTNSITNIGEFVVFAVAFYRSQRE